jgi:hypothetical protein
MSKPSFLFRSPQKRCTTANSLSEIHRTTPYQTQSHPRSRSHSWSQSRSHSWFQSRSCYLIDMHCRSLIDLPWLRTCRCSIRQIFAVLRHCSFRHLILRSPTQLLILLHRKEHLHFWFTWLNPLVVPSFFDYVSLR